MNPRYKGQELGESKRTTHGNFEHLGTDAYKPPTRHCQHCNNVFTHPDRDRLEEIYRRHMARKHPDKVNT